MSDLFSAAAPAAAPAAAETAPATLAVTPRGYDVCGVAGCARGAPFGFHHGQIWSCLDHRDAVAGWKGARPGRGFTGCRGE